MVERLAKGKATVKQLAEPFAMSLPAVMQHLQVLESAHLVVSEKVGRVRTCSLNQEAIVNAEAWFVNRRETWETLMDRMVEIVEAEENL
jgi:DNA-binding transcriptional ArsR family regulator